MLDFYNNPEEYLNPPMTDEEREERAKNHEEKLKQLGKG